MAPPPQEADRKLRAFFAEREAGTVVMPAAAVAACVDQYNRNRPGLPVVEPTAIATRWQLERKFASSATGKKGAADGITGEVLKTFAPEMAAIYHPLTVKAEVNIAEPFEWKGGGLDSFYKGTGDPGEGDSMRAIMVSPHVGKRVHSCTASWSS